MHFCHWNCGSVSRCVVLMKDFFRAPFSDVVFAVFRANSWEKFHNIPLWSSMTMRWIFSIISGAFARQDWTSCGCASSFVDIRLRLNSLIQKSRFAQPSTCLNKNVLSLHGISFPQFLREHFVRTPAKGKLIVSFCWKLVLAMCTTVGGVASDSITWSVRREIDSWAIWHRVKNRSFNLFCKSNNNFHDNVFTVVANLRVCGFFLTVDRHPGTLQHTLLVFCFVDVHTTTPPAPVDEYINAICHVLH